MIKEFGGDPPMSPDEMEEHEISHAAEGEAQDLVTYFRRELKRDVGRVWGDEAAERREEEAKVKAIKSVIPRLMDALELPAGETRDREVKYLVYLADSIHPGFYEPPAEWKAAFIADPSQAGPGPAKRLMGTIPSLGINLD